MRTATTPTIQTTVPEVREVTDQLAALQVVKVPAEVANEFIADAERVARVRLVKEAHSAAASRSAALWDELTASIPTPGQISSAATASAELAILADLVDRLTKPASGAATGSGHFGSPFAEAESQQQPQPVAGRWSSQTVSFILATCSNTLGPAPAPITSYRRAVDRYQEAGRHGEPPRSTDADLEAERAVQAYSNKTAGGNIMAYGQTYAAAAQEAANGTTDPLLVLGLVDKRLSTELPALATEYEQVCALVEQATARRRELGLST